MDELLIQLLVRAIFGSIVAAIAHSRGRSVIGWFLIGSLTVCLGLILVLVLPDLKVEDSRRDRLRRDNRRLRERVNKERQISDQRHAETSKRLGAHDAVLGVETSTETATPPKLRARDETASAVAEQDWHYAATENSGTEGPIPFDALHELWQDGALTIDSLVWTSGMDDWLTIAELPDLRGELERG